MLLAMDAIKIQSLESDTNVHLDKILTCVSYAKKNLNSHIQWLKLDILKMLQSE